MWHRPASSVQPAGFLAPRGCLSCVPGFFIPRLPGTPQYLTVHRAQTTAVTLCTVTNFNSLLSTGGLRRLSTRGKSPRVLLRRPPGVHTWLYMASLGFWQEVPSARSEGGAVPNRDIFVHDVRRRGCPEPSSFCTWCDCGVVHRERPRIFDGARSIAP